jgi:site-specific DNA recombinase
MKKGRYVYYRCTGFRGACGNTYIREEELADRLGALVERIQIPPEIADWIAERLHDCQDALEQTRRESVAGLTQRRQTTQSKLDRGYDDYLEGRLSERASGCGNQLNGSRSW